MDLQCLGAIFFVSKGHGNASNASKFNVTVAAQLVQHILMLTQYIYDANSTDSSIVS
jgi:hypothetical protein